MDFKQYVKGQLKAAANPTITGNTFAGVYRDDIIPPLVVDPAGLEDHGLATVYDRSKDTDVLYEADDTIVMQDASPLFNDQGTTADLTEINLVLTPYDFGKTISLDVVRTAWLSGKLAAGSLNDYTLDELVTFYVQNVYVPKLKMAQDNLVLRGKTGLASKIGTYGFSAGYNGLYSLWNAATGINKVSIASDAITVASVTKGTTTTLTTAAGNLAKLQVGNTISVRGAAGTGWSAINGDWRIISLTDTTVVIAVDTDALTSGDYTASSATIQYINANNIIEKAANHMRVIPQEVMNEDSKLIMPRHLEVEWQLAVGLAQQNGGSYILKSYDLQMISKRIVFLDNAAANTIGTWTEKHVFYGYDLSDDYSNIEILWQGATGNKVYNVQGKMKTGIAITKKFEDEVTLSTPDA